MSKSVIPESWLPTMRIIEFSGVLVVIAVVLFDFIVERPADRIIRAWVVIAQSPGAEGNIGQSAALTVLNKAGQDIRGANLSRAWLVGANLRGLKLGRANLTGADLTGANLTSADLSGTFLWDTDLTGADLTGADLTGADLTGANLTNADLTGADLTDAELTDADLADANNLTQDQLDSACIRKGYKLPALPEGLKPPPEKEDCGPLTR